MLIATLTAYEEGNACVCACVRACVRVIFICVVGDALINCCGGLNVCVHDLD